jgi:hypothetical protein
MVTVALYWIAASYLVGIGLVLDQLRRTPSEWQAAGRDRRFWVALSLILGFHGLGQYALAGYLGGVVPRLHRAPRAGSRRTFERFGAAVMRRWNASPGVTRGRGLGATEELALIAALLVFASSFIHSVVIADHFQEYWLFGAFFAVVTCLQAICTVLIYGSPLSRRLLVAGAVGNGALALVWAISRTVGVPVGPQPWRPEAAAPIDVPSALD